MDSIPQRACALADVHRVLLQIRADSEVGGGGGRGNSLEQLPPSVSRSSVPPVNKLVSIRGQAEDVTNCTALTPQPVSEPVPPPEPEIAPVPEPEPAPVPVSEPMLALVSEPLPAETELCRLSLLKQSLCW